MPKLLPPNGSSLERHVAKLTERLEQYPTEFIKVMYLRRP